MFWYELTKLLKSKFVLALAGILFVLLGLLVYLHRASFPQERNQAEYYEAFTEADGRIKQEIAAYYQELDARDMQILLVNPGKYSVSEMGDRSLIKRVSEQSAYALNGYASDMEKLIERSLMELQSVSDAYGKAYYEKSIDIYNQVVQISVIPTENAESFLELFHGSGSIEYGMALILFVIMVTVYTFGWEENGSFACMIRSTPGGRGRLVCIKLIVLTLLLICLSVILFCLELAAGYFLFGMDKAVLGASIQSLEVYELCDIKLNIFGALSLACAGRLLLLLTVMCITAFLTGMLGAVPAAVLSTAAAEGVLLYLRGLDKTGYMNNIRFMKIRQYNPLALLYATDYMKSFDYGRFFRWPVNILYECLIISAAAGLVPAVLAAVHAEYVNRRGNIRMWGKGHGTFGKSSDKTVRKENGAEGFQLPHL